MKYVGWLFIGLAIFAVITFLIGLFVRLRKKRAENRVKSESMDKKILELNRALSVFGFTYNEKCDCIISDMNSWQREMGYCRGYDEAAPAMNMMIDCEPVYFRYDGKDWLLEFWKGQYGCTTGAEIGLYYNNEGKQNRNPEELFYTCADDGMLLYMQFSLWKGQKCIMERSGAHWWLTGFLPGVYSEPDDLVMRACVFFRDYAMRNAFCEGLLTAGYGREEIMADNNRVCLTFRHPRTKQPTRFGRLYRGFVSFMNRLYCKWYLRVSRPFGNTPDRISFLGYCFPFLYRRLIRLGMRCNRKKLEKYRRRKRFPRTKTFPERRPRLK